MSLASAERRGSRRGGVGEPVFLDGAPDRRRHRGVLVVGEIDYRRLAPAAPGVVLCVADGIARIVVHLVAGEDLGGRLRREIDLLIGVAAGKRALRPRQGRGTAQALPNSLEPASGTFVWSMRRRSRPSGSPTLRGMLIVGKINRRHGLAAR